MITLRKGWVIDLLIGIVFAALGGVAANAKVVAFTCDQYNGPIPQNADPSNQVLKLI